MTISEAFEKVFPAERQQKQLKEVHGLILADLDPTDKNTITSTAYGLMGAMTPKDIMNHFAFSPKTSISDEFAYAFETAVLELDSEKAVQILCACVDEIKPESKMPFYNIES